MMMSPRTSTAALAACIFLAVLSFALLPDPGTSLTNIEKASAQEGGDKSDAGKKSFSLVYNVNNAGYIDVCGCKHKEVRQGSITRRAAFLKQLRGTGREILLLDGGSAFYPINKPVKPTEIEQATRKAELIVESYNHMGYRAMTVGPYDLVAGLDSLVKITAKAKFKILSANFADKDGKLHFEPHTVFTVNGVKVGVFGLTLDTIPAPRLDKWAPGSKILDPMAAAEKAYAELQPNVDLVIALAHLREDSNFELIKKLGKLEILIDPYIEFGSHKTWLKQEEEWLGQRDNTLFLRSDGQGARLGIVDVELVKKGAPLASGNRLDELLDLVEFDEATAEEKKELTALKDENYFRFTRVSLEPHHSTDPHVDALVDAWKKNVNLSSVKVSGGLPNKSKYLGHASCKSCHEKQYAFWKTTSHSHALETLEKTNDHQRYDCVGCHTLGYGQAWLDMSEAPSYADVQCESCHGLQPEHTKNPKVHSFGRITRNSCLACHNKEQTRIEFPYVRAKRKVACPKG